MSAKTDTYSEFGRNFIVCLDTSHTGGSGDIVPSDDLFRVADEKKEALSAVLPLSLNVKYGYTISTLTLLCSSAGCESRRR
jgi:hypothetical protein